MEGAPKQPKEISKINRREVLTGALATAGAVLLKNEAEARIEPVSYTKSEQTEAAVSTPEKLRLGERERAIEHETLGTEGLVELYGELGPHHVLFMDDNRKPLERVELKVIDGVSPGEFAKDGHLEGRLNQEWLNVVRKQVATKHGISYDLKKDLPQQMNVIDPLRAEIRSTEKGTTKTAKTYLDIVHHHGNQHVKKGGKESLLQYLDTHLAFGAIPKGVITKELHRLVPGLGAQESQFKMSAKSPVGARGVFQFMPQTWKEMGYKHADITSYEKQVVAVGRYFSNAYLYHISQSQNALSALQSHFQHKADFDKYFVVPLLINSYNSGAGRLENVMEWFLKQKVVVKHDAQYTLFNTMACGAKEKVSGYGDQSCEYVPRVYALAQLLGGK